MDYSELYQLHGFTPAKEGDAIGRVDYFGYSYKKCSAYKESSIGSSGSSVELVVDVQNDSIDKEVF